MARTRWRTGVRGRHGCGIGAAAAFRSVRAQRRTSSTLLQEPLPRVVIVGAGFAGLTAARELRGAPVQRHGGRPAQPPPLPAAALPGGHRRAQPGRHLGAHPQRAPAPAQRAGGAGRGDRHRWTRQRGASASPTGSSSRYDFLIVGTGATHSYFGRDDWAPLAPGLKTHRGRARDPAADPARLRASRARDRSGGAPGAAHLRDRRGRSHRRGAGRRAGRDRPPHPAGRLPPHPAGERPGDPARGAAQRPATYSAAAPSRPPGVSSSASAWRCGPPPGSRPSTARV